MSQLAEIIEGRPLFHADSKEKVRDVAQRMSKENIGAVAVLDSGRLVGVFSERDVMNRVVAVGRMPGQTRVSEVMTVNPRSVTTDESIDECLFLMREFGFRHLPICEGKQLKGLVSLRDIMLSNARESNRRMAV